MSNDINIGQLSEAVNAKMDRDCQNIDVTSDQKIKRYIVETYNDDDGNWYEVYSDGWVVQGGSNWGNSKVTSITVTYLLPMLNSINQINVTLLTPSNSENSYDTMGVRSQSETGFVSQGFSRNTTSNNSFVWEVKGYKALD